MTTTFVLPCSNTNPLAIKAAAAFPQRLYEAHEGRISLRETAVYADCMTHIDVRCEVCGYEWSPCPNSLISNKAGCPACQRQKAIESAGIIRRRRASAAEKEFASRLRKAGLTYEAIAKMLNRGTSVIRRWLDPAQRQKNLERSREKVSRDTASGRQAKLQAAYRETEHGRLAFDRKDAQRRAYKMHAVFSIQFDVDSPFQPVDCVEYITSKDDREHWTFAGANKIYADMRKQCRELEKETGVKYAVDHIIPLNAGGIDYPDNFQIIPASENSAKRDRMRQQDAELFCRRLFDIK